MRNKKVSNREIQEESKREQQQGRGNRRNTYLVAAAGVVVDAVAAVNVRHSSTNHRIRSISLPTRDKKRRGMVGYR